MAKRSNISVKEDLAEEARDAVVFLQGKGTPSATLSGLVEEALTRHLASLKRKHKVKSFPKRKGDLRPGRRL